MIFYNTDGKILFQLEASDSVIMTTIQIQSELGNQSLDIPKIDDISKYYVENSKLVLIPIAPDNWYDFDFTDKTWKPNELKLSHFLRMKRDDLLKIADIEIFKAEDIGILTQELRAYRQALRDIPTQTGFPLDVIWPIKPSLIQ